MRRNREHVRLEAIPTRGKGLAVIWAQHKGKALGKVGIETCTWHLETGHAFPWRDADDVTLFDLERRPPEEVRIMEAYIDYWVEIWRGEQLGCQGVELVTFLGRPREILDEMGLEDALRRVAPEPAPKTRWVGGKFLQPMRRRGLGLRFRLGRA